MRGLDPRIHSSAYANGDMDRRVKPGDDSFQVMLWSIRLAVLLCASVVIFSYGATTRR
jgi:hypothetical protein